MTTIKPSGFMFGTGNELPEIRGFAVIERRGEFVTCEQGGNVFLVEKQKRGVRLMPLSKAGVRPDCAIFIPGDNL